MRYEPVYQGLQLKLGKIISNLAEHDQIELSGGYVVRKSPALDVDVCQGTASVTSPIDRDLRNIRGLDYVANRSQFLRQHSNGTSRLKSAVISSTPKSLNNVRISAKFIRARSEIPRVWVALIHTIEEHLTCSIHDHAGKKTSVERRAGQSKLSGRIGSPEECSSWERYWDSALSFAFW
jgi:hypothetical protein